MNVNIYLLLFMCKFNHAISSKILAILPVYCRSHDSWNRALLTALNNKGHSITVLSADHNNNHFHRSFRIKGIYESMEKTDFLYMSNYSFFDSVSDIFQWGQDSCRSMLSSEASKNLLALPSNESFDLMIIDSITQECVFGYANKFGNPPIIAVYPFGNSPWLSWIMGNLPHPAYMPLYDFAYSDHMNIFERIINTVGTIFLLTYRNFYHLPEQEKLLHQYLIGSETISLKDIEKQISLAMINTNFALDYPQPLSPNVIPVGGLHIKPVKPLPKTLLEMLDNAKQGFIYFSLGSVVRSAFMTLDKQQAFMDAFSALPQLVLWKWESDNLTNRSSNVITEKWISQNDVLAHPNIRLFITHGGLLSTQEAVYHGVPVLGIPIYADQRTHSYKAKIKGFGDVINYNSLTSETLLHAIQNILNNSSYADNARKLSTIFREQSADSTERAIYWVEHVIRHKGAQHLQLSSKHLSLYQFLLLDVLSIVMFVIILCLLILRALFSYILHCFKRNKSNISKNKKRN